jgi:hypothetical protein
MGAATLTGVVSSPTVNRPSADHRGWYFWRILVGLTGPNRADSLAAAPHRAGRGARARGLGRLYELPLSHYGGIRAAGSLAAA